MGRFFQGLRLVVAGMCAYETVAIVLDRPWAPTFSRLAERYPWLAPSLIAGLTVHLIWPVPEPT